MHELPTQPLFFHPPCVPFTFAGFFFVLLFIAQGLGFALNDIAIVLPLNDESVYHSSRLGHARVPSFDVMEQHVLMKKVMVIMSEVELMLGFCLNTNMYVPSHLLHFDILLSFLFCGHDMFFFFLLVASTSQGKALGPRYEDVWVPNPKEPMIN